MRVAVRRAEVARFGAVDLGLVVAAARCGAAAVGDAAVVRAAGTADVTGAAVVGVALVATVLVGAGNARRDAVPVAAGVDARGTNAGREVGAAVVDDVVARSARGLPADAIPTTTTAQPTTAAHDTVADTTLPILM